MFAEPEPVDACGPAVIVVLGAIVSTVHSRRAGLGSAVPAASRARTLKTCEPWPTDEYVLPDEQAAQFPPSRRHWKEAVESGEEKRKVAEVDGVSPRGPDVNDVSGGRSTRQE